MMEVKETGKSAKDDTTQEVKTAEETEKVDENQLRDKDGNLVEPVKKSEKGKDDLNTSESIDNPDLDIADESKDKPTQVENKGGETQSRKVTISPVLVQEPNRDKFVQKVNKTRYQSSEREKIRRESQSLLDFRQNTVDNLHEQLRVAESLHVESIQEILDLDDMDNTQRRRDDDEEIQLADI